MKYYKKIFSWQIRTKCWEKKCWKKNGLHWLTLLSTDCLGFGDVGVLAASGLVWAVIVCWSSAWVYQCTDRWKGSTEILKEECLPLLSNRAMTQRSVRNVRVMQNVTGCVRKHWWNNIHKRKIWVKMRDADGQEERGTKCQRGREGKLSVSPHPASSAVLALPRSGKERLPTLSPRCHVGTQSLPLPC